MPAKWLLPLCLAMFTVGCHQPQAPIAKTQLANHGLLSAALSPNGERLFTGSFQHGGALWDQSNQARLFDWNHSDEYSAYLAADFSEDGRFLAATDGTSVTIWNTETGESMLYLRSPAQSLAIQNTDAIWQTTSAEAEQYWQRPARIVDLAFSRQYLLLGLENQVALLVDSVRGQVIGALGHEDLITDVAMGDQAKIAITGTRGGDLTIWSLDDGTMRHQVKLDSPISFTAIAPNGERVIVAASHGPVELITLEPKGLQRQVLFRGNPGVIAADFSEVEQGELILGSSREQVWRIDLADSKILAHWRVPKQGPWHKAAIVAIHSERGHIQAIASDGYAYQLN